ncbi:MAG: hypothetical protein HYU27_10390 [Acidobacteria bacterium]|nr:hypothetical protein [Acidobacteriota bacterium]
MSADSGLPTGYGPQEIHPALLSNNEVIRDGADLLRRLNVWRVSNNEQTVVQTSGQLKRPRSFTIAAVVMFGIGALYLAGAFLSATASSTDPFGLPEILVVVGPACLFVAYGLSILGLRRRAIALGWTVIGFSSILALFYPMIVILAWALHLWWFVRFRRRRSLLV